MTNSDNLNDCVDTVDAVSTSLTLKAHLIVSMNRRNVYSEENCFRNVFLRQTWKIVKYMKNVVSNMNYIKSAYY